jgi:hypothetical protein
MVSDGPGGLRYDVTSQVPAVDRQAVLDEAVSDDRRASASVALPADVPPSLPAFLATVGANSDPAGVRLAALEQAFRSDEFGSSTTAAPGHSIGRIEAMLPATGDAAAVAVSASDALRQAQRVGTPEQFASAFAVLARAAGYPARVVVGYRIDPQAAAAGAAIDVRTDAISAWPEVLFENSGWVAYDPTNPNDRPPQPDIDTGGNASVPASAPLETQAVRNCLELGTCLEVVGSGPQPRTVAAFVLLGLLVATPLGLWSARVAQRARRRRGSSARQVVGAWQTARDRLRLAGIDIPPGTTVLEAAGLAHDASRANTADADPVAAADGGPGVRAALEELSALVDVALFDAAGPADGAAGAARRCEERIRQHLARSRRRRQRMRAAVDPRPLVWPARRERAQLGAVPHPAAASAATTRTTGTLR